MPRQTEAYHSKTLIDDKPTVRAGYYIYYRIYIDISEKKRNMINGKVIETAGYDINFYVFNQENYNSWKEGISYSAYVTEKRINSCTYSFVPDHSDYYYFVLDNSYSFFTNKVPSITAEWSYQATETVYETVTKTAMVSLFQLLIGQPPRE